MSDQVFMDVIPWCDFCEDEKGEYVPERAYVDGRTRQGPWAYMCREHWSRYGVGVFGTGNGQRLILKGGA